jgi:hypothetical protein
MEDVNKEGGAATTTPPAPTPVLDVLKAKITAKDSELA